MVINPSLIFLFLFAISSSAQELDFFAMNNLHQQVLSDDDNKRVQALKSLSSLDKDQKKELIGLLEPELDSNNIDRRVRAMIALEKIEHKRAKKILKSYQKTQSDKGERFKKYKFNGTDSGVKKRQDRFTCFEYENAFVLTGPSNEGDDVIVVQRKRGEKGETCENVLESRDFHINHPWQESFFGLYHPYLFIHNTSDTQGDWMSIYDVRDGKKKYSTDYAEPIRIRDNFFEYWKDDAVATKRNCPDKYVEYKTKRLDAVIKRYYRFDLYYLKEYKTEKTRCIPR